MYNLLDLREPEVIEFQENTFTTAVQTGALVPFLGAGASTLRAKPLCLDEVPWDRVALRLNHLLHVAPDQENYLRNLARTYDIDPTAIQPQPLEPGEQDALMAFQVSLAALTSRLVSLFSSALSESAWPSWSIIDWTVPTPSSAELTQAGMDAADKARGCIDSCPENFLARDVHEKLTRLVKGLIDPRHVEPESLKQWCTANNVTVAPPGQREIHINQVTWLSELFWHTLTHGHAQYPSSSELSFRLSLVVNAPPRTRELSQIAQDFGDYKRMCKFIREEFKNCSEQGPQASAFHKSIARALYHAYEVFKTKPEDDYQLAGSEPSPVRMTPVAFTTNFDQRIEQGLDEVALEELRKSPNTRKSSYHVVYPVVTRQDAGQDGTNYRTRWYMTAIHHKIEANGTPVTKYGQSIDVTDDDRVDRFGLAGPVVVKLHGSPVHDLPTLQLEQQQAKWSVHDHCIVIAESHYLAASLETEFFPDWIQDLLTSAGGARADRLLCFIGYSLSDWNVRLRVFHNTHKIRQGAPKVKSLALNRSYDQHRTPIMGSLGVPISRVEIDKVREVIDRTLRRLAA